MNAVRVERSLSQVPSWLAVCYGLATCSHAALLFLPHSCSSQQCQWLSVGDLLVFRGDFVRLAQVTHGCIYFTVQDSSRTGS
eukprot:6934410-Prymnesium_polylepis.1